MLIRVGLIFFIIFITSAKATTKRGYYPMITSISTQITSDTSATYTFTQQIIKIGAAADALPPANSRFMCLGHRHDAFPGGVDEIRCLSIALIDKTISIGESAIEYYNNDGSQYDVIDHIGKGNGKECVGYFAVRSIISPFSEAFFPPGSCVYAPPGNQWCKLISPALVLDHGMISMEETAGHSASDTLSIECAEGTTVRLRLIDEKDYIELTPHGRSTLSIEGKAPGANFNLPAGRSTLTVSDKLSGLTSFGDYYGSSVLIIEPI